MVYCPYVLKGSLKSPACVISGKLCSGAPSTYFFLRSHFRCERKFPYSVRARIREKFSCIFERVRFSSCTYTVVDKQKKNHHRVYTYTRGEAGIWRDGTRISAVHHRGLLCGSHVTMGGRDKADYSIYGTLIKNNVRPVYHFYEAAKTSMLNLSFLWAVNILQQPQTHVITNQLCKW